MRLPVGLLVRLVVPAVLLLVVAELPIVTLESATEATDGNAGRSSGGDLGCGGATGPAAAALGPVPLTTMGSPCRWWLPEGDAASGKRKPAKLEPTRHARSSQERTAGLLRQRIAVAKIRKIARAVMASASAP